MRVGVLVEQALAPVPGGTGRYSVELAAALARTAADDDTVSGWTSWHRDMELARVGGVDGPRRLPLGRRALAASWERGLGPAPRGVDVLHAPTPLFPPRRQPLVVTVHDTVPWTHPETLTARGARWHRHMAERAARVADAIAVPTQAVRDELHELLPATRGRIHVLGAGVSAALRRAPEPAVGARVAARLRLPETYVLSLATLEPRKGLDLLIEAIALLGPSAPPLVVVGQPGWGGVDLRRAAASAGVDPELVHALGKVSDGELAVLLRGARLLVAPSRAEGFGLPVAEAMAVGTPVVCSDAPALVEVAGDAASIVARGDPVALAAAIGELLADAAKRERLATAGLARAARFDWDVVAHRAWTLYYTLLEGSPGRLPRSSSSSA